jgi:hypothetical protein
MRILGRRYMWAVNHTRRCTSFSIPGGRNGTRGPVRRVRACQDHHSGPPIMYAADGMQIPFPNRYRRSEEYQTAGSVLVDIFLNIDREALDIVDSELVYEESSPDGEIDFESLEGRYSYLVQITIRQTSSLNPITWVDLISRDRRGRIPGLPTPVGVGISVITPSDMGRSGGYSRRLRNGVIAEYTVHR